MNISVIGTGYVGLCTGVGFAIKGNHVICMDNNIQKITMIQNGQSPIYEKDIDKYLKKYIASGTIKATNDLVYSVQNSDITFLCVGTPPAQNGNINLEYVKRAAEDIGRIIHKKNHLVVVKSTVVPGTTEGIIIPVLSVNSGGNEYGVCVNPEFLREGKALEDVLNPERIVIGEQNKHAGDILENLYNNFNAPIIRTNLKTAEMIKYASNAFLATKVSFINEIGNLCKKLGIDVYDVAHAMGYDSRISPDFLRAGIGFGGSCFSKDIEAIARKFECTGERPDILNSVLTVNKRQKTIIVELLRKKIGSFTGKKISVLGLAFNPNTDDIRESVAIDVIKLLLNEKATVSAYDSMAAENMKKIFPNVVYTTSIENSLRDAHACLILTEWDEFKRLSDKDFDVMKEKIIIEGRKVLNKNIVSRFEGVCW